MLRNLFNITILVIIMGGSALQASSGSVPVVVDNNPSYVDEFVNPITLNWTIRDDNLREHRIFANGDLLQKKNYTQTEFGSVEVLFLFSLGNGRYNFTLWVIDADNHTTTSSSSILKGEEVSDLEETSFPVYLVPITIPLLGKIRSKIE